MLYIVATPIGNLADFTFRAIETLSQCDFILCEDTRYSQRLLQHYNIQKPCRSFHKFNEKNTESKILSELKSGKKIALISDAGTPGISDPSEQLVKACAKEGITVTPIPGACAAITALCCSGLSTTPFQFCGFLERAEKALKEQLLNILNYPGTTICYESPNRLGKTLRILSQLEPNRQMAIAKELTKIHEQMFYGTAANLLNIITEETKGEFVLLISGAATPLLTSWEHLPPQKHVEQVEETYGISRQEAMKLVAQLRGISRRDIYQQIMIK